LNFHCPRCERLVEVASFRAEGATLFLVCATCGTEGKLEAAPQQPPKPIAATVAEPPRPVLRVIEGEGKGTPEDQFTAPPTHCPKCVTPRMPDAPGCPRCGLTFANFDLEQVVPSDELKARWTALVDRWGDPAEHDRAIQYAAQLAQLAPLARLYRIRLARHGDDPQASRSLEALISSIATLSLTPTEVPERRWMRYVAMAAIAVAAVLLCVTLLDIWKRH
jgi:hypothetical protein